MSLSYRIISGELGGRILKAPKELPVRPTKNQVKESLFNIIQHKIELKEAKVLDLFCGLGSVSFEFISRGANVSAVDYSSGCIDFIKSAAYKLMVSILTYRSDVFEYLEKDQLNYDIVFADPPYNLEAKDYQLLIDTVLSEENLFQGLLILEHSPKIKIDQSTCCIDSRKYGSTCLSIFQKPTSSED